MSEIPPPRRPVTTLDTNELRRYLKQQGHNIDTDPTTPVPAPDFSADRQEPRPPDTRDDISAAHEAIDVAATQQEQTDLQKGLQRAPTIVLSSAPPLSQRGNRETKKWWQIWKK